MAIEGAEPPQFGDILNLADMTNSQSSILCTCVTCPSKTKMEETGCLRGGERSQTRRQKYQFVADVVHNGNASVDLSEKESTKDIPNVCCG